MLAMALPEYRRVASMPSAKASLGQLQGQLTPADMLSLWAYLAGHCPDAHKRQQVWELRLATVLLQSFTAFLWGQVDRASKGRARAMSDVEIQEHHTALSWIHEDVVGVFLDSDTRGDLVGMLSVDDVSLATFHQLCRHATSAVSEWTRLGAMLVQRVDLAHRRRAATLRTRWNSG
jgi:hypothetical protein